MNDADEKVRRVMTRIEVWSPGEKCLLAQPVGAPSRGYYCLNHGTYAPHDIPCPDPSDPAIKWAMLEWLTLRVDSVRFGNRDGEWTCAILRRYRSKHDV